MAESGSKTILVVIPVIFGILGGLVGQGNWQIVQLFLNRQDFGQTDAQYGKDLGFYAFELPLFSGCLYLGAHYYCHVFMSVVTHYLLGGITAGNPTTGQKDQNLARCWRPLAAWAGVFMLLKAVSYWLDRYELLFNRQNTFTGGSYTDINALLPAKITLLVIALVVAAAFFAAIFLRNLAIPAFATVLMLVSAGLIGVAWPLAVEQFSVRRTALPKSGTTLLVTLPPLATTTGSMSPRSRLNAIGEPRPEADDADAAREGAESVASDDATLANIRILDPEVLPRTFTQQRQLKNFYGFTDPLSIRPLRI